MSKRREYPELTPIKDVFAEPTTLIKVDPFGSYTGRPLDCAELPVQDADDL